MPTEFLGKVVSIDTYQEGNLTYFIMVDCFMNVAETEPMKLQDAETVASTLFHRLICWNGVPESVHSNQGPNFVIQLFTEL